MRHALFTALVSCVGLLTAATSAAQTQDSYVALTPGTETPTAAPVLAPAPAAVTAPEAAATMVLVGHVNTAAGTLPGAVIKLARSKTMVVTDADGSFHVTVPVGEGPVQATASYAGFADEAITLDPTTSEVRMSTPQIIQTPRKQQLKAYLKTSRKQGRKTMRRIRR